MGNSINWGKIYETTWWGDTDNTIGWGNVYEGQGDTQAFQARVLADGGIFEAELCLINAINDIP